MPLRGELGRSTNVVPVVGVATVDDRVAGLQARCEIAHGRLGDLAGRDHDPRPARHVEPGDEVVERARARRALGYERRDRLGVDVVDDAGVAARMQPADDVRAHPAETDHAELHALEPIRSAAVAPAVPRSSTERELPDRNHTVGRGRGRVTGRDAIEIHEADGAFERDRGVAARPWLLRPGRGGARGGSLPRLRALLDDPTPTNSAAAGAMPASARRLFRPGRDVCCRNMTTIRAEVVRFGPWQADLELGRLCRCGRPRPGGDRAR